MVSESQNSINLPIVDISQPLMKPSSLSAVAQACKEWGFFNIVNHGISKDLYNKMYSLLNHLFSLPSETKLKLGPFSSIKTYTPHFIASPFFESLRVSGPDFLASAQSSADVLFDHHNSEFRFRTQNLFRSVHGGESLLNFTGSTPCEVLQEYGSKMTELAKRIVKIVLMSLGDGFEMKYYDAEFKDCHGYLRINNYSPPKILEEETEGLGMHTDMSCITIVYQDEIGGLQVRSKEKGRWMDIIPCEGSLVVNIGDLLQAWSNEKLRSCEHRVVLKQPLINRFSLAFFWCFEDEKVILAPDEVVAKGNVRFYKPFVCSDYVKFRENNERGKFEKVGFTVKDFSGVEHQI